MAGRKKQVLTAEAMFYILDLVAAVLTFFTANKFLKFRSRGKYPGIFCFQIKNAKLPTIGRLVSSSSYSLQNDAVDEIAISPKNLSLGIVRSLKFIFLSL